MLKEDILRAYLEDDLFVENKYLQEGEAQTYKWASHSENNLIEVLKIVIDGTESLESPNVTERKINSLLNK